MSIREQLALGKLLTSGGIFRAQTLYYSHHSFFLPLVLDVPEGLLSC